MFITTTTTSYGQFSHIDVFPESEGEELLQKVVESYRAQIIFMDYGRTRDTLFSKVYQINDSLRCVYSGHTLYMDPEKDPTTTVYMNGADNGINTEHTFPRSKGAEFGNPLSDMHHLYPTRSKVNEERSNFPFGEIDDDKTDIWFYKDKSMFNKPTTNIDKYSEWKWMVFEPREDHKGNVARAVMYFYTMYKDFVDQKDPDFFWNMLPAMCEWHYLDPVDSLEWVRTFIIAEYQQFPNPFILDCSLAARAYCGMVNDACAATVDVEEINPPETDINLIYFNSQNQLRLESALNEGSAVFVTVTDVEGKIQYQNIFENIPSGPHILDIETTLPRNQLLFVQIKYNEGTRQRLSVKKISTF